MNIEYHQGGGDSLRRYQSRFDLKRRGDRRFLAICIVLAVTIFAQVLANRKLKPITFELAKSYGSSAVLEIINDSVSEFFDGDDIGYSDLVRLKYNSSGFVTSIEYDSAEINRLKIGCLGVLNKNLSKLRSSKVPIPLGSLFGDVSLSGRGPRIKFRVSESAVPDVEVMSTFESVGMNQSRHEIRIRVTALVTVFMPPSSSDFTVTQDYVLAQTVIVGDVPAGYSFIE